MADQSVFYVKKNGRQPQARLHIQAEGCTYMCKHTHDAPPTEQVCLCVFHPGSKTYTRNPGRTGLLRRRFPVLGLQGGDQAQGTASLPEPNPTTPNPHCANCPLNTASTHVCLALSCLLRLSVCLSLRDLFPCTWT